MRKTYIIKDSPVPDFALEADPSVSEGQEVEVSLLSGGDTFKMKVKQPTLRKVIVQIIRAMIDHSEGCRDCGCKVEDECSECGGYGLVECDACGGTGEADAEDEDADAEGCGICDGEGEIDCDECDGGTTYLWSCGGTTRRSGGCGGEPSFTKIRHRPEAVAADDDLDSNP